MTKLLAYDFENTLVRFESKGKESIVVQSESGKEYLIGNKKVKTCFLSDKKSLLILITDSAIQIHSTEGIFQEASLENIQDYYYDELSESFFRKDIDDNWIDIQGYIIPTNFLLKGNVLISLSKKASLQSMSFDNAKFITDTNGHLVQVNKLVFNRKLERVKLNESKVISIGRESVVVNGDVYQQVYTGLTEAFYVRDFDQKILKIDGFAVTKIVHVLQYHNYYIITAETSNSLVSFDANSPHVIKVDHEPLVIQNKDAIILNSEPHVHGKLNGELVTYNLKTKSILTVETLTREKCHHLELQVLHLGDDRFHYVHTVSGRYVVNAADLSLLKTADGEFIRSFKIDNRYSHKLLSVILEKGEFVLNAENLTYLLVDGDKKVNSILTGDLLLEVIAEGQQIIADSRKGLFDLRTAYSDQDQIIERNEQTHYLGNNRLMNVKVKTFGGAASRVVKLNTEALEKFTLPSDLTAYPERAVKSVFCDSIITSVDFEKEIEIEEESFYSAEFISFLGEVRELLLSKSTGRPLHFEGLGQKMELAIEFKEDTMREKFFLGENRMIGVKTLDENLKVNELMFSLETMSSQIMFLDSYLPVLKRPHLSAHDSKWDYFLYQLRALKTEVEFLVVEKDKPNRILVHKLKSKILPKFVKSNKKILKTPEEVNYIKKILLMDPGFLVEV